MFLSSAFSTCPMYLRAPARALSRCVVVGILMAVCVTVTAEEEPTTTVLGPMEYTATTRYAVGSVVVAVDGNRYRAKKVVEANDPTTDDGEAWQLERVDKAIVLDVPGRFAAVTDAWSFLADATIATQATVTIQLAPGRYPLDAALQLGHADGQRIVIEGGQRPDRVVLLFKDSNGIEVHHGGGLLIKGLTVKAVGRPTGEQIGITVGHGAELRLERCSVEGFLSGVVAADGGCLTAAQCTVETSASPRGVGGFKAMRTGVMTLRECKATQRKNGVAAGSGFWADAGGSLHCEDCSATGWNQGFLAASNGALWLQDCDSNGNQGGLLASLGGTASASRCEFSDNARWGINAHAGSIHLSGCTMQRSRWGICSIFNGDVSFRIEPSRITKCDESALLSKGGGTFNGPKPTVAGNRSEATLVPTTTPREDVFFWD